MSSLSIEDFLEFLRGTKGVSYPDLEVMQAKLFCNKAQSYQCKPVANIAVICF